MFPGHVPWRRRRSRPAADSQARPLPKRVKSESAMIADDAAVGAFDGTRRLGQMPAQELIEGPLPDEADAGAVGFVVDRKPGRVRAFAHFLLAKVAQGKEGLAQGGG